MKLGICTTDFKKAFTPDRLCAKIASFGVSAVQLAFESVALDGFTPTGEIEIPERVPVEVISSLTREASVLGLSFLAVNGTFNMAHPSDAVRAEGVQRFAPFADAVAALGCPYITVCTGTRNEAHLWRYHADNGTADAWADMRETMARCAELADSRGLKLCVEVEASNVVDTPRKARTLLDDLGGAVKIVLDPANLFHIGKAHPEYVAQTLKDALELLVKDTVLLHGKDIREGEALDFCSAGAGIVDFGTLLEAVPDAAAMLVHGAFTDDAIRESLAYLRGFRDFD
ncbi:MAG: sugar phosphate isomerase/epimerase [Clostridiaceae bacterium]|nr:sugar phosphate isomerase/epimerase [Clostridiaceae bacterium]